MKSNKNTGKKYGYFAKRNFGVYSKGELVKTVTTNNPDTHLDNYFNLEYKVIG